jgi:hypothetical protein
MAQFGGEPDSGLLVGKYLSKIRVYVESMEDRDVLEKWFPDDLGEITFLSADHENAGGGGCQAVCREVTKNLYGGVTAFGVVDRDKLFTDKNWVLLWEADDQKFRLTQPYGAEVYVLLRWELENYLLEPKALQRVLSDAKHGKPAPTLAEIEQELLDHCDTLVPVIAASALLHDKGIESPGDGYKAEYDKPHIEQHLNQQYLPAKLAAVQPDWEAKLKINQMFVANFDKPGASVPNRLSACLRITDGKRVIERIKAKHSIQQVELRGFLSRGIKELGLVPVELSDFISDLK